VTLDLAQLPADFDPGDAQKSKVVVQTAASHPRRSGSRASGDDKGRVLGPDKAPLEDIVIRLAPSSRYTSTNAQGVLPSTTSAKATFDWSLILEPYPKAAFLAHPSPFLSRFGWDRLSRSQNSLLLSSPRRNPSAKYWNENNRTVYPEASTIRANPPCL